MILGGIGSIELIAGFVIWLAIAPPIRGMQLEAGINVDACFSFKLNNFPIEAKIALINPGRELHWTGVSLWFKAVDLHVLEPIQDDGTRLYIAESFSGFLASLFISSEKLRVQHEKWLAAFKSAAENGR